MLKKNVIFYFQVFLLPLCHPKKIILSAQEHKMCQNPAYSKLNQYPLRHMKYQGPSINSREKQILYTSMFKSWFLIMIWLEVMTDLKNQYSLW